MADPKSQNLDEQMQEEFIVLLREITGRRSIVHIFVEILIELVVALSFLWSHPA